MEALHRELEQIYPLARVLQMKDLIGEENSERTKVELRSMTNVYS